jgi:uncharacterized protein YkwD
LLSDRFTKFGMALVLDADALTSPWKWTYALSDANAAVVPADPPGAERGSGASGGEVVVDPGEGSDDVQMTTVINQLRSGLALPPVVSDPALTTAAQAHSTDMATRGVTTHIGGDGSTFLERAVAEGFTG